jgi:hypothetical protein
MAGDVEYTLDDRLSRFIRHKRHVAQTIGRVKPAAFLPDPHNSLSLFHPEDINESQIWRLADEHLAPGKSTRLRADISVRHVRDNDLSVDWNYNPKYHIDIIDWPEEKDDRLAKALDLAKQSELKFRGKTS